VGRRSGGKAASRNGVSGLFLRLRGKGPVKGRRGDMGPVSEDHLSSISNRKMSEKEPEKTGNKSIEGISAEKGEKESWGTGAKPKPAGARKSNKQRRREREEKQEGLA